MYNDLFQIGPVTAHSYGLFIAIGAFLAFLLGERLAKKKKLNPDVIFTLTILCFVSGFASAKLLFCIVEWEDFISNPMSVISSSGFVVYGGIIGGIVAAWIYCRKKKLNFWGYFDIVLPSVAVAQAFGRIGCFMAGCCYGRETDSFIGIAFENSKFAPNHVKLIPTQLISSAGMFLIAGILLLFLKKSKKYGQTGSLYLILYSIGRFGVEFLRSDHRGAVGALSTSQFISLFIVVIGFALFFTRKEAPAEETVTKTGGQDGTD